MALDIKESFEVRSSVESVWAFINNPENVVACMPGASLKEVVDPDRFIGSVKLKIGAVSAQYQGTITYVERDQTTHTVKMLAAGNERGGGTVSGTIVTRLESLQGGSATRVDCESSIDLTGKIIQVGRGMIEGVSAQIIKRYVGNVRMLLEVPANESSSAAEAAASETASATTTASTLPQPRKDDSINVIAIVFKVIVDRIVGFFRGLFGRA